MRRLVAESPRRIGGVVTASLKWGWSLVGRTRTGSEEPPPCLTTPSLHHFAIPVSIRQSCFCSASASAALIYYLLRVGVLLFAETSCFYWERGWSQGAFLLSSSSFIEV
ncbi:hypothetical protein M758_8G179000 [Ceratodon purpureus]|nr:hypothetical protein M758_8G179000 [Ceratodon purpureus]